MYLVEIDSEGELRLTKNLIDPVPRYAILSHTWINDDEEVSFADMQTVSGRQKQGFAKLKFCAQQAQKDDLRYFWMDTCCIDRTNSVELSEAITSMFHWYREAVKCYAYLGDVHVGSGLSLNFQQSRWFTRGWTLQELLAPKWVDFFSSEGQKLGDRNSLESVISEITQIPIRALRGRPLYEYTIEERLAWMKRRHTKRDQDKAYGLQGLFDVSMIPNYGETSRHAMDRLIKKIRNRSEQGPPWDAGLSLGTDVGSFFPVLSTAKQEALPIFDSNYNECVKPLEQVVEEMEKRKGWDHPMTLIAVEKLGMILQQHQDHDGAAHQYRRTLRCREQRRDLHNARRDLVRLACALSVTKEQTLDITLGRRTSDYYLHTPCAGGNGGSVFACIAEPGFRVKRLKAWYKDSSILAIQLDYSDGSRSPKVGKCNGEAEFYEHAFKSGEVISEATVWSTPMKSGVQLLECETIRYDEDNGRSIDDKFSLGSGPSGSASTRLSTTGTGILVGVHGSCGNRVDSLGLVFLSPSHALAHQPIDNILQMAQDHMPHQHDVNQSPGLSRIDAVGGIGGFKFEDIATSPSVVKELRFWTTKDSLRAVQVKYDDGTDGELQGLLAGAQTSLTFGKDESITKLALWTNKNATRVTRVEIETSQGVRFESAPKVEGQPEHRRNVKQGAVLVGIHGGCGDDVDRLGFIMKEPES